MHAEIEKRKDKLLNFINKFAKEKEDKIFLAIFVLTIIINIYFFTKTYSQAVWFDEADYLNFGKYLAFGFPEWSLGAVRPPLFSLISALFFKIGLGEIGLRILMLVFGISNTLLIYLIGKELNNKKVGLVAAVAMSTFWSHLFFTSRLLVDVPVLTFWLLSSYFFIRGYINKANKKLILLIVPVLFLGFLIKYLNAFLAIIFLIYLLITERLNFLKDKYLWISTGIALVLAIPFFIFQKIQYGSFFAFMTSSLTNRTTLGRTFTDFLIENIKQLFPMIGIVFLILFIIGLIKILEVFLGLDLIIKNKDKDLSKKLFLPIWLLGTLAFASKLGFGYYIEERYSFNLFASAFLILAIGTIFLYEIISRYNKSIASILVILLLVFGAYQNLTKANMLIEDKAQSFIQVKQAGQFLEQNLAKDEGYLSPATSAEIQYHSNRKNMGSDIKNVISNPKIKYAVISGFNPMPEEYPKFIQENQDKFKPVVAYALDKEGKQPIVVIFEIIRN